MLTKMDNIKRVVISLYDPKGMEFVGGFDAPFSRKDVPKYRARVLRLKKAIPGLYGLGVRKPITRVAYLTKRGRLVGKADECFGY